MSSSAWFNINDRHSLNVVGNVKQEVFLKDKSGFLASTNVIMPPTNSWASYNTNGIISNLPSSFVGTSLSLNLSPPGFTKRLIIKMNVTNTHGSSAINVLPHFLINKIDFINSEGNLLATLYDDNIYLFKIFQGYEKCKKIALAEGLSISSYNNDSTLASGASRTYYIHIPSFIDASEQILSSLKSKMQVNVSFQSRGTDTPANLRLNSFDIVTHGTILEPIHMNIETTKRKQNLWKYRYLEPIRAANEPMDLVANSSYKVKLTSGSGYCAFLMLLVRPSALTFSNQNSYQKIDRIELLDAQSNIIGVSQDSLFLNTLMNEHFPGDILTVKQNIYLIPFSLDPNKSRQSMVLGYMKLTGAESLRIYTEGTISSANYTFTVYSYEYQVIEQSEGNITATRF